MRRRTTTSWWIRFVIPGLVGAGIMMLVPSGSGAFFGGLPSIVHDPIMDANLIATLQQATALARTARDTKQFSYSLMRTTGLDGELLAAYPGLSELGLKPSDFLRLSPDGVLDRVAGGVSSRMANLPITTITGSQQQTPLASLSDPAAMLRLTNQHLVPKQTDGADARRQIQAKRRANFRMAQEECYAIGTWATTVAQKSPERVGALRDKLASAKDTREQQAAASLIQLQQLEEQSAANATAACALRLQAARDLAADDMVTYGNDNGRRPDGLFGDRLGALGGSQ